MEISMSQHNESFLRNHADTLAIIAVNIALGALLLTMILANTNRVDAVNARSDDLYNHLVDLIQSMPRAR